MGHFTFGFITQMIRQNVSCFMKHIIFIELHFSIDLHVIMFRGTFYIWFHHTNDKTNCIMSDGTPHFFHKGHFSIVLQLSNLNVVQDDLKF